MRGVILTAPAPERAPVAHPSARRRGFVALADQGVVSGASFLTALLIGRATSPAELGKYTVALTVVLLLVEVQNSLVATPYTVARPRLSGERLAQYTSDATLLQSGVAMLAAAMVLLSVPLLGGGSATLAAMLGAAIVPMLLREHLRKLSFAGFEMGGALRLDLLVAVLQLTGVGWLAFTDRLSAGRAFGVLGASAAAGVVWWWRRHGPRLQLSWRGAVRAAPAMWQSGRWVLASGVTWALGLHAYPWLLAALRGAAEAGLWAAGLGLASLANPVLIGMGNYLAPRTAHVFAAEGARRLAVVVRRTCGLLSLLMIPLLALALALGERLVELAYGAQYANSGLLVFLLSVHLWMTALAFPVSRALFALERADVELCANLVGLAAAVAFGLWLVQAHGAQGGALGLAMGGAAANLARMLWLRRLVREAAS